MKPKRTKKFNWYRLIWHVMGLISLVWVLGVLSLWVTLFLSRTQVTLVYNPDDTLIRVIKGIRWLHTIVEPFI